MMVHLAILQFDASYCLQEFPCFFFVIGKKKPLHFCLLLSRGNLIELEHLHHTDISGIRSFAKFDECFEVHSLFTG
jgi:hypothetical protein